MARVQCSGGDDGGGVVVMLVLVCNLFFCFASTPGLEREKWQNISDTRFLRNIHADTCQSRGTLDRAAGCAAQ